MKKLLLLVLLLGCSTPEDVQEPTPIVIKKSKPDVELEFKYDIAPIISKGFLSQVQTYEYLAAQYARELNVLSQSNEGLKKYMIIARKDLVNAIQEAKTTEDIKNCLDFQANLETAELTIIHTDLLIKELRQKSNKLKFFE